MEPHDSGVMDLHLGLHFVPQHPAVPEVHCSDNPLRLLVLQTQPSACKAGPSPELPPPRVKDVCGVASGPLGRHSPSSPLASCASPLLAGKMPFTQSHHQIILPCPTVVRVDDLS